MNSEKLPTAAQVREALLRRYRNSQFNWQYRDLFAELMRCPRSSSLASGAERAMRSEYPEFHRRSNVLRSNGEIVLSVVEQQASAVQAMCARFTHSASGTPPAERAPIVLRPHDEPFNFLDRWTHPVWQLCGVYLWSIPYCGAHLVGYVGQVFGRSRCFETRIWEELKRWEQGKDHAVDIDEFMKGRRRELSERPDGHLRRELAELKRVLRLWLMPLSTNAQCNQAERWLVAQLCKDPVTRQFLGNRNPGRYCPNPQWEVQIQAPASFQIVGLTVRSSRCSRLSSC